MHLKVVGRRKRRMRSQYWHELATSQLPATSPSLTVKVLSNQTRHRNGTRPARMVLLENFGTEPLAIELERSNCTRFVCLPHEGLPNLWCPAFQSSGKRAILKGPREMRTHSFTHEWLRAQPTELIDISARFC